jgi:translation initiation factor 2 alpha subunit (eIF-2alpha)
MQEFDLHNKFLEVSKEIEQKFGAIRKDFEQVAEENIPKIKDKKIKLFMENSLKNALSGNLTSEEFIKELKDIQNAD